MIGTRFKNYSVETKVTELIRNVTDYKHCTPLYIKNNFWICSNLVGNDENTNLPQGEFTREHWEL